MRHRLPLAPPSGFVVGLQIRPSLLHHFAHAENRLLLGTSSDCAILAYDAGRKRVCVLRRAPGDPDAFQMIGTVAAIREALMEADLGVRR